jgi:hypothetical protein
MVTPLKAGGIKVGNGHDCYIAEDVVVRLLVVDNRDAARFGGLALDNPVKPVAYYGRAFVRG